MTDKLQPAELALVQADERRAETKQQLFDTLGKLQRKVSPEAIAADVLDSAKEQGSALARKGARSVSERPAVFGAVVAGVGLFLARKRIARLFGGRRHETADEDTSLTDQRADGPQKGHKR